jgi:hypothetical protein
MRRHVRQERLAEVGAEGQARIASACVEVRLDGLAADVAVRYLAGAGVGRLRLREDRLVASALEIDPAARAQVDPTVGTDDAVDAFDLRDRAARDVMRGALTALRALRAALEKTP